MAKERISATVDEDLAVLLDQEHINVSGTVNKLLRRYFDGDDDEEEILEFRIEQVESDLDELRARVETKERELEALKERHDGVVENRQSIIEQAAETLGPGGYTPKDTKIQYWSNQAGVGENELIEQIEQYHNDGDDTQKRYS